MTALVILYVTVNSILDTRIDEDLIEDVVEFKNLFQLGGENKVYEEIKLEQETENAEDFFIRVLDSSGEILFSTNLEHWKSLKADKLALYHASSISDEPIIKKLMLDDRDEEIRIAYGSIAPNMIIHIGESTEDKEEVMEIILIISSILILLVVPIASVIGWFITRKAALDITAVSNAAIDIEKGNFDRKVNVNQQHDEIRVLANTFNSMAERIRILIAEMREMIDNIAHDLRSPLGRIRAISENTISSATISTEEYQSAAADTLEECDRLIHLINTTLDVAEAEAGVSNAIRQNINLSKLVEDACELFEPAADRKNIKLSCNLDSDCKLMGERSNLQRMLSNLLDNALKYTSSNGKVNVSLKRNTSHIDIKVSDSGIGIPKSAQQRIFERFFRVDHSRTNEGCGLGLSFARAVARAHGGDIDLQSSPQEGSTFIVTLPLYVSTV